MLSPRDMGCTSCLGVVGCCVGGVVNVVKPVDKKIETLI